MDFSTLSTNNLPPQVMISAPTDDTVRMSIHESRENASTTNARPASKKASPFRDIVYTTLSRLSNLESIAKLSDRNSKAVADELFANVSMKRLRSISRHVRRAERNVQQLLGYKRSPNGKSYSGGNMSQSLVPPAPQPDMYPQCPREVLIIPLIQVADEGSLCETAIDGLWDHVRCVTADTVDWEPERDPGCSCAKCAAQDDASACSDTTHLVARRESEALAISHIETQRLPEPATELSSHEPELNHPFSVPANDYPQISAGGPQRGAQHDVTEQSADPLPTKLEDLSEYGGRYASQRYSGVDHLIDHMCREHKIPNEDCKICRGGNHSHIHRWPWNWPWNWKSSEGGGHDKGKAQSLQDLRRYGNNSVQVSPGKAMLWCIGVWVVSTTAMVILALYLPFELHSAR